MIYIYPSRVQFGLEHFFLSWPLDASSRRAWSIAQIFTGNPWVFTCFYHEDHVGFRCHFSNQSNEISKWPETSLINAAVCFPFLWVTYHARVLVGGFKHGWIVFNDIWVVILPIDELIFFKMVKTTNQILYIYKTWWLGYLSTIIKQC